MFLNKSPALVKLVTWSLIYPITSILTSQRQVDTWRRNPGKYTWYQKRNTTTLLGIWTKPFIKTSTGFEYQDLQQGGKQWDVNSLLLIETVVNHKLDKTKFTSTHGTSQVNWTLSDSKLWFIFIHRKTVILENGFHYLTVPNRELWR